MCSRLYDISRPIAEVCVPSSVNSRDKIFISGGGCKTWAFRLMVLVLATVQSQLGSSCLLGHFCRMCMYDMLCVNHNLSLLRCLVLLGRTLCRSDSYRILFESSIVRFRIVSLASLDCLSHIGNSLWSILVFLEPVMQFSKLSDSPTSANPKCAQTESNGKVLSQRLYA